MSVSPSRSSRSLDALARRDLLKLGAGALAAGTVGSQLVSAPASAAGARADRGAADRRTLERQAAAAAQESGVPTELLLAIAWVHTRGRMPAPSESAYERGAASGRGEYGPAGLVRNPFADTLGEASRLTGISARSLMTDRAANLRGGADLLASSLPGSVRTARPDAAVPGAALDALADAAGTLYAEQVNNALADHAWEREVRPAQPGTIPLGQRSSTAAAADKPPVTWYPAHSNNFTSANRPSSNPINTIVIHVTQGSWSSALNWFQNPNAGVSAHYTVRSSDGRIGQSLADANIGWHAGNWSVNETSIGIEHEGYVDDPSWFTEELFDASARLAAFLCTEYGIPIDRNHIIGHNEVPGADHTDPGQWWWWSHYMDLVNGYA